MGKAQVIAGQNPWTVLARHAKFEDPWMSVVEDEVLNPKGRPGRYATVGFKKQGSCAIPIDGDGCTYLVGQYRYATGEYSWEIPGGGSAGGEEPILAAARELREEVGFVAASWRNLLNMKLCPSLTDARVSCFLAWNLRSCPPEPEEQELLAVRRVPFSAALDMVLTGEISNATTVAAILQVEVLAARRDLPADLLQRLV